MKKLALALVILFSASCKTTPSGEGTATPAGTPAAASDVSVTLSAAVTDYRAEFGSTGRVAAPMIPLTVVVKNGGVSPWKCEGSLSLSVEGQGGKVRETRAFLTTLSPCELAPGAEHREELEAGELLTSIASQQMKGDHLAVRAAMPPSAPSAPLSVHVFVPEG